MSRSSRIGVGNRSISNNSDLIDVTSDIDAVKLGVAESKVEPLTICIANDNSKLNVCFGRPTGRYDAILVCSVNCLHFRNKLGCSNSC